MEPPIPASTLYKQFKKVQPKQVQQSDESDVEYYELAQQKGWQRLKEYIESSIADLESVKGLDPTDTVETVALKFLASETAKAYLKQVIGVVEASHEYIREKADQ